MGGQRHAPGKRRGIPGSWVGPTAGLDGCEESLLHRDPMPGPSGPQPIAIPTELSWPSPVYSVVL